LPTAASTATAAGSMVSPLTSTGSPMPPSEPRGAMWAPRSTGVRISTRPSGRARVFSTGCTAVAPEGTGAPVMIWMASPSPTARSTVCPARAWATTRSVTGALAASSARTA